MLEPVPRGTDALLPHLSRGEVEGVEGRVQAGVADHVETRLDPQEGARREVGGCLGHGEVQAAALSGRVGVVRTQGGSP